MSLPGFHAADLDDHRRVERRVEFAPHGGSLSGGKRTRGGVDRIGQDNCRNILVQARQRIRRVAAVADREIRAHPSSQPFGPVGARRDIVRPEDERHMGAPDDAAEKSLRPGGVADDAIVVSPLDNARQRAPCLANCLRTADARFRQLVNRDACRRELGAQPAIEAQGDFRLDRRTQRAQTRHRQQQRLDAAKQIAAVDVKDAHVRTGVPARSAACL